MAIQKTKVVNGVSANFWITRGVFLSPDLSHARAELALYETAGAYASGAAALDTLEVDLVGGDNPVNSHALAKIVEDRLVTLAGDLSGGSVV